MPGGRPNIAQATVRSFMDAKDDRVLDVRLDERGVQALAVRLHGRTINVRKAVERLTEAGHLHALQGGRFVYTAQPAPSARLMNLDPAAEAVLRRLGVPYYVSWHSALWHHGLIDQQSRRVYVAVSRRKRQASIGMQRIQFVFISDQRKFFGAELSKDFEWPVNVARPEKAIIDSLDRPRYAAPVPVVADALRRGHREGLVDPEQLVKDALRFGSPHLNRRLGFFMELFGLPGADPLTLHLGRGWAVPLDPSRRYDADSRPHVNRRWRVFEDPTIVGTALELK